MSKRRNGETKYTPLLQHLQALPADQDTVTLTLPEVEAIIGAALPPGARAPGFWTGAPLTVQPLHAAHWRASLAAARDAVTFRRVSAAAAPHRQLDDAVLVAAYAAGATTAALAQQAGVHGATVLRQLHRAGAAVRPPGRRRQVDHAAVSAAYQAGASVAAVAVAFEISRVAVYTILRRTGTSLRGRH